MTRKSLIVCLLLFPIVLHFDTKIWHLPDMKQFNCLVKNIYYEARGEPKQGQVAVGLVTLNRTQQPGFSKTICGVVHQPGQFSWTENDLSAKINRWEWRQSRDAAYRAITGNHNLGSFPAIYFHNIDTKPNWDKTPVKTIGNHIFYE